MDGLSVVLGSVIALVGTYGLYFAARGKSARTGPVTRFLFAARRAEPSRAFTALNSAVLIAWGAYFVLAGIRPGLPLWPSFAALLAVLVLQVAARLQRHDA